MFYIDPL